MQTSSEVLSNIFLSPGLPRQKTTTASEAFDEVKMPDRLVGIGATLIEACCNCIRC